METARSETRRTVLIVDDEPANLDVLRQILKADYRTKAVTSGEAAITIARSPDPPDLILLDVTMPGMSGIDVCRSLASDDVARGIPVLFVTSRDDPTDEAQGFAAGAVDYIHKPVNPHIVRARVKAQLELVAARQQLQKKNEVLSENLRLREEVDAINQHDLKGPLMVVLNVPDLLLASEQLSTEGRKLLGLVADAGRKMLDMINRAVDMYRMESGTYVLRKIPVDVLKTLQQVGSAQKPTMAAKGLLFEVSLDGRPAEDTDTFVVPAEELLLYSMLTNLIVNAVEASPAGEKITASVAYGDSPTVSVHNAGAIPEVIRGRFMQKFATAGKEHGTGLGAYSAKLIATTMGGAIDFQTSEQSGTTITVRLQRA